MEYNLSNPIAERPTKTVYRDGDKTIKLFVENYPKTSVLMEGLNQARVEEGTSLNIPKLLAVTTIENRWALVSEHIEGDTLEKLMNEHPEKLDEYLNIFVDTQIKILACQVPMLNRMKDKYRARIQMASIDDTTKYEILTRMESMKNHTKLCHGDFNPSNVVVRPDGSICVIDWAHVTQGNASGDVALTYLLFKLDGKDEIAEKYINLFAEKSGIPKHHLQQWIPIIAAAQKVKGTIKNQEFIDKFIDVVDFE